MTRPLVTVVTPTWGRHDLLLGRCVPSVHGQSYRELEHVVVSDGPDAGLAMSLSEWPRVRYHELPDHDPVRHWGGPARRRGIEVARGQLIAYIDDDDAWRPDHVAVLVAALSAEPGAGFAFSRMMMHTTGGQLVRIGDGRLSHGRIATSMIVHRRELLDIATWGEPNPHEDWLLVDAWLSAGVSYASVDAETVDYYPSNPVDLARQVPVAFPPPERGQ